MTSARSHASAGDCGVPPLAFAYVNRRGWHDYDPDLQRHHLLPRQALRWPALQGLFAGIDRQWIGFDDFRRNGLLLPARSRAALRMGLPLHRGPHRTYNMMVIDRLGMIEHEWSRECLRDRARARETARMRIALLQRALRRRILDARNPLRFNRADPLGTGRDFTLLDQMADELWRASA